MGMTITSPVFTRQDGLAAALRPRQMRVPTVQALLNGVYLPPSLPSDLLTRSAAALRIVPDGLLCGATCLALHDVALPPRWADDATLHIRIAPDDDRPRRPQMRAHRLALQLPPRKIKDLPCVHPIEAWMQLAATTVIDDLVLIGDGLIRRQRPLTTLDQIVAAVADSHRRPGIRRLRQSLPLLRERTDSIQESRLRLRIVQAGLPCPEVNVPILTDDGWPLWFIDMAYKKSRLGVEYDGAGHVADRRQMQRDAARRRVLEDMGWRIITVTAADLCDPRAAFIGSIRRALTTR